MSEQDKQQWLADFTAELKETKARRPRWSVVYETSDGKNCIQEIGAETLMEAASIVSFTSGVSRLVAVVQINKMFEKMQLTNADNMR